MTGPVLMCRYCGADSPRPRPRGTSPMVKIRPTYATRKLLIERRIKDLRNNKARYINHGWVDEAVELQREIIEARAELKALTRA